MNKILTKFIRNQDGMGTVEIVIVTAILIGIALVFKKAIFDFMNGLLNKVFNLEGI